MLACTALASWLCILGGVFETSKRLVEMSLGGPDPITASEEYSRFRSSIPQRKVSHQQPQNRPQFIGGPPLSGISSDHAQPS